MPGRLRASECMLDGKKCAWAESCVHGRKAACMGAKLRAWAEGCVHGRKAACMGGKVRAWAESCVHGRKAACMHACTFSNCCLMRVMSAKYVDGFLALYEPT